MIQFIAPSNQTWILRNLIERLPQDVSSQCRVLSYHNFKSTQKLTEGYCIFTGLGVLTAPERQAAIEICNQIVSEGLNMRLLNHPENFLDRYELLKTLFEKGINKFRAFRIDEIDSSELSYPVFIREFGRHSGSLTDLLHDDHSVRKELNDLLRQNYIPKNLLVVEYCHTADKTGLFRKYSAQKIGDAILPRYLSLDYHWVVKEHSDLPSERVLYDSEKVEEEVQYMRENPHEEQIRRVFEIAGIDFGRIDYGFKNGKLQVWEINTLPTFGGYPGREKKNEKRKNREESKSLFYKAIGEATRLMLTQEPIKNEFNMHLPLNLRRQLFQERIKQKILVRILMLEKYLPDFQPDNESRSAIIRRINNWKYS